MKLKRFASLLLVLFIFSSCSHECDSVEVKPIPSSPSMCSTLAKNMFKPVASSKIIISVPKVDTTSSNYHISRRWDRDCMCGAGHSSLE